MKKKRLFWVAGKRKESEKEKGAMLWAFIVSFCVFSVETKTMPR